MRRAPHLAHRISPTAPPHVDHFWAIVLWVESGSSESRYNPSSCGILTKHVVGAGGGACFANSTST